MLCSASAHPSLPPLSQISTIPDDIEAIAEEVRGFSSKYDFVLTSGGIGPTHDDVTVEGIAKAFDEELVHCKELEDLWPEATNFKSKFVAKMMRLPKSAKIQFGSDPSCPLVIVHNVHIYPGVPQYLKTMFVSNKSLYCNSDKRFYRMIALLRADELDMAEVLEEAQMKYNGQVSIGSYPILGNSLFTLKVTGESTCMKTLDKMCVYLRERINSEKIVQIRMSRSHSLSSSSSVDDGEDVSVRGNLRWLLQDKVSKFPESLIRKIVCSKDTIEECVAQYKSGEICLAYNGGKDCTVLLHLLHAVLTRKGREGKIKVLYISSENPFKEVDTFIKESIERYNLHMIKIPGQIREALHELKMKDSHIKAILLGTRYTDPFSDKLTIFCPTDTDWPEYMRVHPILEWSYTDVWSYLRTLNIPYCPLYDMGYTSLGSTNNTVPNPSLKKRKDSDHTQSEIAGLYHPAYMLADDTMERAGRN
jgi:FAD synthetase